MAIPKETLDKINTLLSKEPEFIECRKISSLTVGNAYVIKKIVYINTRFGKTILVTLYDESNDKLFQSFLPKRVVETMSEKNVENMNMSEGKYTLTYMGQSLQTFSGGKTRTLLSFGYLE